MFGRSASPLATVAFRGVTIAGEGRKVFEVEPKPGLDARGRAAWRRWVAAKAKQSDVWAVTPRAGEDGPIQLERRLTIAALRTLAQERVGEEAASVLPLTFAAPVEPLHPVSLWGLRMIAAKVLRRQKGEVKIPVLGDVVTALPGWGWSEGVFARPLRAENWRDERALEACLAADGLRVEAHAGGAFCLCRYAADVTDADEARVRAAVTVVADEPALGDADRGRFYAADVRRLRANKFGEPHTVLVVARFWCATFARCVTAPDGDRYVLFQDRPPPRRGRAPEVCDDAGFWPWAYQRGFGELAEGVLAATDPVLLRRALTTSGDDLVNTGECQCCARVQKLDRRDPSREPLMIDHGYFFPETEGFRGGARGARRRPCRGVGWRPYELAHDLLDVMLAELRAQETRARDAHRALLAKRAARTEPVQVPRAWVKDAPDDADSSDAVTIGPDDARWTACVDRKIDEYAQSLRDIASEIAWVTRRIAEWRRRPLYAPPDAGIGT